MTCTKCGGRIVEDDVHTYLGKEVELKCISCGKRFVEPMVVIEAPVEVAPAESKCKSIGTCSVCGRTGMYLTRDMCQRDYVRQRRANLRATSEHAAVSNPASPWRTQLYDRAALAKHELSGSEPAKADESRPESVKADQSEPEPVKAVPSLQEVVLVLDDLECRVKEVQRAEGRGQRAEGRGQRAEGRGQRAEGRGQRAETPALDASTLLILQFMAVRHASEQAKSILKG
jgi:hypothetical protein